eukprot:Nitzschia sp. Nitz4//scaffold2_size372955//91116//91931//NITZ4_000386-RA/size372955-augustus-gene-0.409-mRNA-1//-1//CDS//3329546665//5395//frame0
MLLRVLPEVRLWLFRRQVGSLSDEEVDNGQYLGLLVFVDFPQTKRYSAKMASESNNTSKLHSQYPITSSWEFTLQTGDVVKGQVYCTDPVSNVVVLQDPSLKTITMVSLGSVKSKKKVQDATTPAERLAVDLMPNRKALEEREKRALKMAQESLKRLNPKASPKGQAVFDLLLKACNEVVWQNESIIVLNSIQVDAPYDQGNCKLLKSGSGQGSLERVQKIVAAAANGTNS